MTKLPLQDRADVQDLIARYAWALDTGDLEGYVGCFEEDGWIEHHPPGRCVGRDEIRGLARFLWYEHPNDYLGRQHRMSQVLLSPEGAHIRVKAFWSILQHNVVTQENVVFGLGTWDALVARQADDEWLIRTLFVDIWRGRNVPWVGDPKVWTKSRSMATA